MDNAAESGLEGKFTTDRAYRIGQQQNVTVYHLVAKQNLADAILEGTGVSHAITLDELRELIG